METPYEQGQEAFYKGFDEDENPYHETDPRHDEWANGYLDADIQESGDIG